MPRFALGVALGLVLGRWLNRNHHSAVLTERVRTNTVVRLLFRVLDDLYDIGLGRLAGRRFLRVAHRGRRTGRTYHTVVEVIDYDPTTRESIVLSGWGDRADWYRNILKAPAIEITTAGQRYKPMQRMLDSKELYTRLQSYVARNRILRPLVRRTLGLALDGSAADQRMLEQHGYCGVAFRPSS